MSSSRDWIGKFKGYKSKLRDSRVLYFATTETMTVMQDRIWGKGRLTDGSTLKYKEDYEVYIYKPPFPRNPNGKGKPYEEWIIRPESVSENRSALVKRVNKLKARYTKLQREFNRRSATGLSPKTTEKIAESMARTEVALNVAEEKLSRFRGRFGGDARKIKGQWAPTYLAAKGKQGRADLPFELTGDMRIAWLGGATPTPKERGPFLVEIVVPEKEYKKIKGLEETKGNFTELTAYESKFQDEAVARIARSLL